MLDVPPSVMEIVSGAATIVSSSSSVTVTVMPTPDRPFDESEIRADSSSGSSS